MDTQFLFTIEIGFSQTANCHDALPLIVLPIQPMKLFNYPNRLASFFRTFCAPIVFLVAASLIGNMDPTGIGLHSHLRAQDGTRETSIQMGVKTADSASASASAMPTQGSRWKYTRFGWQDSRTWFRADSHVESTTLEKIHPSLIAANILLAALGAIVWLSDDRDVYRWLRRTEA